MTLVAEDLSKGHRARLRGRYLKNGYHTLHDYEQLELLLIYAIARKDVKPMAKELLHRFGSIQGVLDASLEQLCEVSGISSGAAALIHLVHDLSGVYLSEKIRQRDKLDSPTQVKAFARSLLGGRQEEAILVIYTDIRNQVVGHEIISEGTVDHAVAYPRKIVAKALNNHASGVIMVHNHPSDICDPSRHDVQLTKRVKDALKTVDIRFLDHLIVGAGNSFSFVDAGML